MSKPSEIVVIVEDQRHQQLVRRFLYRMGFTYHQIRDEPLPSGRGCGEQWVREHYPIAVKAYRQRSSRAKSALVVAIDADMDTIDRRRHQLREVLIQKGLRARSDDEAIAHLIPKRNIETWLLYLTGQEVDEAADYRHDAGVDRLISGAASAFFDLSRDNAPLPPSTLASLVEALPEVKRIDLTSEV